MPDALSTPVTPMSGQPQLRRIGIDDLTTALRRGWADFMATPTQLIFLCILYPALGLVAATVANGGDLMHLLYPMAAGFALVGPLAALGLYEISRRREAGQPTSWTTVFEVTKAPGFAGIVVLGVGLVVLFLAWLWVADAIYAATLGTLPPASRGMGMAMLGTAEGKRMAIWGNLAGFAFALVALAVTVVSFPLLLDRGGPAPKLSVATAVGTSVRAVLANPVPMAVWGLIVASLLLLGSLPLFIGLAVVLPVLGHATWHLYRLLVVR